MRFSGSSSSRVRVAGNWESLLELQIYDSVATGGSLDANDIERLTQNVASRFSVWFGGNGGRELAWVQPIQFYTWPLYRVNYVIAELLALQYLDKLHRDPADFAKKYGALLRNGYDAPPEQLLQRFLGVSLSNPDALVNSAVNVIQQWVGAIAPPSLAPTVRRDSEPDRHPCFSCALSPPLLVDPDDEQPSDHGHQSDQCVQRDVLEQAHPQRR